MRDPYPFGLNRWLDWGIYHAGGLDSLLGATRWVQSPVEQDDYTATEVFFVRDHLGSPALAMQAKRTLVSGSTYRWELQPVESYEYAPYGDPAIHVPATDGSPQSAGRLALKELESFAMAGAKSSDALLDRNDVGRPNGSTGNTWTRNGAVPVAKSCLGWSHLFTGRPWDADVRQYYIRHRWYEPLTGRWTAVDPIGYRGGLNQYLYSEASPTQFLDPSGLIVVAIGGTGSQRDQSEGYEPISFLFGERLANPGETILKLHGPDSGYDGENEKGWKILKVTYDKATKECQTIHTLAIDAIREARRKNPNERVVIIGHSRGGAIANQIASDLGGVDGLILLDPKRNLGPNSSMPGEVDLSSDVVFLAESSPLPQSSVPDTRATNPDTNSSRDEFEDVIPTYPYPENGNQLYHELFHLSHGAFGGNPNVPKTDACEHTADSNQDGLAELQKWFNDTVIPILNGG